MGSLKKYGIVLFLLGVLNSSCIKGKPVPVTLLETHPLGEGSQENAGSETRHPSKDHQDSSMDALRHQFQKAIRFMALKNNEKARTLLETLRDQHPGVSVFHHNLGIVYKKLGRLADAVLAYRKAIALTDQDHGDGYAEAYYNLAIVLREQGHFKGSEEAYQNAIALSPDFEDAHFNLAVLYDLYLNKPGKAIYHYQKQIELSDERDEEMEIWIAALNKRLASSGSTP